MQRRLLGWGLLAALAGCGGGDDEAAFGDKILGIWGADAPGEFDCAMLLELDAPHFSRGTVCLLNGGQYGLEVRTGTYELNGKEAIATVTKSTCEGADPGPFTFEVELLNDDNSIRLRDDTGTIIYDRVEPDDETSGGGVAVNGCFDADGVLQPRALQAL